MAENLVKDQVLTEEAKKEKKLWYKNWKLYASGLGIIVIGTGAGVGIYYGVNSNATTNPGITDQDIIAGINNITYEAAIPAGGSANTINELMTPEFIQEQLEGDIKTNFNAEAFSFNKITVDGNDLQDGDLTEAKTVTAQINYNYGETTNLETNLTINVMPVATDKDIIDAINSVTTYEAKYDLGGPATIVTDQITADFIKSGLKDENISDLFDGNLFEFKTVTLGEDNHQLADRDLGKIRTLDAKINYTYNSSEIQTTKLTLSFNVKLPLDLGKIVNDENRNVTLEGVTNDSSSEEIIDAIFKAFVPVVKDIVGEDLAPIITENLLRSNVDVELDDTNPIAGATVTAKPGGMFITGTAHVTFTLAE